MRIHLENPSVNALLLCGVPFAQGAVHSGSGLALQEPDGNRLPLWWTERALWPDGSLKWVFLHARLQSQTEDLHLVQAEDPPEEIRPGQIALDATDALQLDGCRLACTATSWRFETPLGTMEIQSIAVRTDPAMSPSDAYRISLVEPSPIAPLLRFSQEKNTADKNGLRFDHLFRLDAANGSLHWQQRLSFLAAGTHRLCGLSAAFKADGVWQVVGYPQATQLLIPRPGHFSLDGGSQEAGHPQAALSCGTARILLEKGWQRAPCAVRGGDGEAHIEFYPQAAANLAVHSGTSFRHGVCLSLAGKGLETLRFSLDPETACATGAFGPLMAQTPRTCRLFPGYEKAIAAALDNGRLTRLDKERGQAAGRPADLEDEAAQDEEYFGLHHYGDWPMALGSYGGIRRMYADNEYDTSFAYFLQFVRTGRCAYLEVAHHSALHMADLDCKATDGDMHFHGYLEQAEDHAEHRTQGGDLGHYWTDGLVLDYLLLGDSWCWEAAQDMAAFLLERFAGDGDDPIRRNFTGCERAVGWPLVALCGVAEKNNDLALMAKMGQMAAYLSRFTADPDRELKEVTESGGQPLRWWRICQEDGTKPFMLGVVLEGLERYHRLSGDTAAVAAIVDLARFLVETLWVPEIEAFIYEWNAFGRPHREDVYPHYINMMVAPGLAYAYELCGDERFRQVATRSFHAALWTLFAPGGGKEIGMVGRTSALMAARLFAWRQGDEKARTAQLKPSNGVPFKFSGQPEKLEKCGEIFRLDGIPRHEGGALHSASDSYVVYAWRTPVATERGRLAFSFRPDWESPRQRDGVNQRCYVHLCDRPFTRSCVSVISFYTGLHVRFYDVGRHYIEVLETDIQHWERGKEARVEVSWDTHKGEAALLLDGQERDCRALDRRLGGAFKRLHLGQRPGNWRADGLIGDLELVLG